MRQFEMEFVVAANGTLALQVHPAFPSSTVFLEKMSVFISVDNIFGTQFRHLLDVPKESDV